MKTLYIIRHAKSSWDDMGIDDFDRNLTERWKSDAKLIWKQFRKKKIFPDKFFCSWAKRAEKTCKIISEEIDFDLEKVVYDNDLYDYHMKWVDFYLSYLMSIKDKHESVFLVWHNPSLSELANYLLWKDIWDIPTTGVVAIEFDVDSWKQISHWNWELNFFIYPKMFK